MTYNLLDHFSKEELFGVTDGIHKYIRLLGLPSTDPQIKWIADEHDLVDALSVITQMVCDTEGMVGKQKHKTSQYNMVEEVKLEMEEFLLTSKETIDGIMMRKRNLIPYHLVVEPTISLLSKYSHTDAMQHAANISKAVIDLVSSSESYGTCDDALISQILVNNMVEKREAARKQKIFQKKRRRFKPHDTTSMKNDELLSELVF